MTTLFVLLDTIIFLFEVAKTYELKRTKTKAMTRKHHSLLNINTYTTGN